MKNRPHRWLSTLLACATLAALAAAQPHPPTAQPVAPQQQPPQQGSQSSDPRHILLPGGLDRSDAKDLLARKLRRSKDLQETKSLVNKVIEDPERYGLKDEDLQKWAKEYAKNGDKIDPDKIDLKNIADKVDPSDPKVKDLVDKISKDKNLTDAEKDSLKRMAEEWKNRQTDQGTTPPVPPNPMTGNPIGTPPMPPTPPTGPSPTVTPLGNIPPAPPPKAPDRTDNWLSRRSKEWLPKGDNAVTKKADSNSEFTRKMRDFGSNNMPRFDNKKLNGSTPTVREGPRVNSQMPNVSSPSVGGGGGGVGSAASGVGNFLLILLGLVFLGVIAFVVYRILQQRVGKDPNDPATLGLVAVDPTQVRTRGDLVRAFEYLALKVLGLPASNEHHLEIEPQLGATPEESPQRREAAGELANLYEHARYTPPEEELSPADLQAARRDLALLGGAATS